MAECLVCTDNLSVEDIIRLVTVCNEGGSVSFRMFAVEFTDDCIDCSRYDTLEELLRKSLYCDENGLFYIQVILPT